MIDAISNNSKQNYIYNNFGKINADTLIVIKDQDYKIIMAFKTSRNIRNLLYSSKDLNYKSYKIYTGGTIDGEETNGLYTKINSYTGGEEITINSASINKEISQNNDISNNILKMLIIQTVLLLVFIAIYIKRNKCESI